MYNLKLKREAAGLSQSQLARASGVALRSIQAYEAEAESRHRDINVASALTVWNLAEVLGCSVGELLELPEVENA